MKNIILIFLACSVSLSTKANTPQVNQPSPDFTFTGIKNWKMKTASLKDFAGKWLIIDAWSLGCISCVSDFPRVNELHRQLKEKATIILVGQEHANIRTWYKKYETKYKLELPSTVDSSFFKQFGIRTVPRYIIIDPGGIIRAITIERLTKEKLEKMFEKQYVFATYNQNEPEVPFDDSKPYAIQNNGGAEDRFLFRSMLTRWETGQDLSSTTFDSIYHWSVNLKNGIQLLCASLGQLYNIAYRGKDFMRINDTEYGKVWPEPILEMKDTTQFVTSYPSAKNFYNYSLIVPDTLATDEKLQRAMQRDLQNYFGYEVTIEERAMPVWEVKATTSLGHLYTKGGKRVTFADFNTNHNFNMQNITGDELVMQIARFQETYVPFINCLGIDHNIDIQIDCLPTDTGCIIATLEKNGIKLIQSTRKMKVIVIRDAN